MKRIIITIAAAALLTGCGTTGATPGSKPTPQDATLAATTPDPTPKPPRPEPLVDTEQVFLSLMRDSYGRDFYGVSDADIVELAQLACDALDSGAGINDLILAGLESGFKPDAVGGLLGAGVMAFCPEHEAVVS